MRKNPSFALAFSLLLLISTLSAGFVNSLNQIQEINLEGESEQSNSWTSVGSLYNLSCQQPTFSSHNSLSYTLCTIKDIQSSSVSLTNVQLEVDLSFSNLNNSSFEWKLVNNTNSSNPSDFNYSIEVEGYYTPSANQYTSSVSYTAEVTLTGTNANAKLGFFLINKTQLSR